jgi:hypothetical protein
MLQEPALATDRGRLEQLLADAREMAGKGEDTARLVKELQDLVRHMDRSLTGMMRSDGTGNWAPGDHTRARRFLQEVRETLAILNNPKDAAFFLKHSLKGETVAELVVHMRDNGLRFAPATAGSERAYISLRHALARESTRLREGKPPPS